MKTETTDKPHPNCAVIGVWGIPEASTIAYLGLCALQHRGQEAAGIVSSDGKHLFRHARMGLVADVFKRRDILEGLPGKNAIGHNRYSTTGPSSGNNVQPLLVEDRIGPIAMSHNGNLVNYSELRRFLEEEGSLFRTSSDSELILQLVARSHAKTLAGRLMEALKVVHGAYSLALLTKDGLIAVRDPHGFRPLCIGRREGGWVIASESCALDLIGAEYLRDVNPGEMVLINDNEMRSIQFAPQERRRHCIFEFIYFSRPDSRVFGDNVDKTRRRLGHNLAKGHPIKDADIVISVPDSANTAALGFSHESGITFEIALIRNHYIGRTFIEPEQRMRDFGVKIKFNPVVGVLKGKSVVVVEDSIVRGTTLKKLVRHIRDAGAREVHVRVSSPPIINPCFYGMDFPTKDELKAAWSSVEEIREFTGADTLEYLSVKELLESVPHDNGQDYCTACFTGDYPIPINKEDDPVKFK
ncbi:MAG: amidophosphoribosyltransferase [Candidatus Hatepunaea meridiana]|nr:amidophosphoribosyltransferase [Candidatus Hatepunaea meridiana]